MFASMFRIFVVLLVFSCSGIYANVAIDKSDRDFTLEKSVDLGGYKNIKFGMDTNTVHSLVTGARNTTAREIYAEIIDTMHLTEHSEALKYYDPQYKLVYIFFFEYSQLYRIDIATYSGGYLHKLDIENPVPLTSVKNIISSIDIEYGKLAKHEREYKKYNGKDFFRDTYFWNSDVSSVSLIVNPTIATLDKEFKHYIYRLTYYNDSLVRKLRSNK